MWNKEDRLICEEEYADDFVIRIYADDSPESPREWDNVGKLCCFHSRMNFPNEGNITIEEAKEIEADKSGKYICLPVYGFNHGMFAVSTEPFSCPWDSGKLGIIYIEVKEGLKRMWGDKAKRLSKKRREQILECMKHEIETYNQWLIGDICGFEAYHIIKDDEGCDNGDEEFVDSCWGFYDEKDAISEAKSAIDYFIEKRLPLFKDQLEKDFVNEKETV